MAQQTTAPLVGYRMWIVSGGRLKSSVPGAEWPGANVIQAQCRLQRSHVAPAPGCTCGIYAFDSLATAGRFAARRRWSRPSPRDNIVLGAVQLWGGGPGLPVIAGRLRPDWRGRSGLQYRAPYARIVALAESGRADRVGRELGTPVVRADYLEHYVREWFGVQLHLPAGQDRVSVRYQAWRFGCALAHRMLRVAVRASLRLCWLVWCALWWSCWLLSCLCRAAWVVVEFLVLWLLTACLLAVTGPRWRTRP
jgi:hypothetical protein